MKKALTVLLAVLAATILCTAAASAADSKSTTVSFNTKTSTLTLKAGNVNKADVQAYSKKDVKHVTAENGAILPEDCEMMFKRFGAEDIDLSKADTSKVTSMRGMFMDCAGLKSVDLSGINTSAVTNMSSMFRRCTSLKSIDLSAFDTSALISADYMFGECGKLKTIDLTGFSTENIEYWDHMFGNCTSLKTIYVSDKWKGVKDSYVTTWLLDKIFDGCTSIKGGNGTTYVSDAKDDRIFARTDKEGEPGYLTYKVAKTAAAKADTSSGISYEILSADMVKLRWNTVEGAESYELFSVWGEVSNGEYEMLTLYKEASLTKNECIISGLTPATKYTLCVRPCSKDSKKTFDDMYLELIAPEAAYGDTDAVKATSRVQYKLINHNKAALKWGAVKGADGYKLYRAVMPEEGIDVSFTTFEEFASLTKTQYSLKKLTADTEYTYAVTAFVKSGDKTAESAPRTVTFRTPYKWYYIKGNTGWYNVFSNAMKKDEENVYRNHFDGSGLEKFNYFKYIPEEWLSEGATEKSYAVDDVQQYGGYIYFYLTNLDEFADDVGYSKEVYRVKSGSTKLERVYLSGSTPDRKLVLDDGISYLGYDTGKENGELIYLTDAKVQKTVVDDNGILRGITLFSEKGWYISNFVKDSEYLYFFTTPYRISEGEKFDEEDYVPSKYAKLWRISLDEPEKLTYDKNGYLKMPDPKAFSECIGKISFPYRSGRNSETGHYYTDDIRLVGCKDGYLYYCVSEEKNVQDGINEVLYRISTEKKNAKPEKLTKLDIDSARFDIQIYGNYIYVNTETGGWRIKLGGKNYTLKKTFSVDEGEGDDEEDIRPFTAYIENGYIYFTANGEFYRVKLNGKNLTSSSTPFRWR